MTTDTVVITSEDFNQNRTEYMRGVRRNGDQFAVGFRGRPFAAVLPFDQLQQERAELLELRKRIAELEQQIRDGERRR